MSVQHITILDVNNGDRLDRWFKNHHPEIAFGQLQKLLRSGQIRLDGKRVKGDTRIQTGQILRLPPIIASLPSPSIDAAKKSSISVTSHNKPQQSQFQKLQKAILYEDEHLAILNKPFGLSVQGGSGLKDHLELYLNALFPTAKEGVRLVHRLDRDTSGVLLLAKNKKMARDLTALFRNNGVKKHYRALVVGTPPRNKGHITNFLRKKGPHGAEIMHVCPESDASAKFAKSYYEVINSLPKGVSFLSLRPITGRTHQLRVHLAHIGCPILGDPKYKRIKTDENQPDIDIDIGFEHKLHLHALRLCFSHPKTGKNIDITAPISGHFKKSLTLLEFDPHLQFEERYF